MLRCAVGIHMLSNLMGSLLNGGCRGRNGSPHQGLEFSLFRVKNKQLLRQRRLVVQHVDQETQRTQVVG